MWALKQADVVKISEEETDFLFGEGPEAAAVRILNQCGTKLVFVTLGKDGCYCANEKGGLRVPAVSGIQPVDTTGAGDIFGGAAVAELLRLGKQPEALTAEELGNIASFACTAASLSTLRPGGIGSAPARVAVLAQQGKEGAPC